jgi:hypothetical protein
MSLDKPMADALSAGGGPAGNKASGLSKLMRESENAGKGGAKSKAAVAVAKAAAKAAAAAAATAPRPIPRRAPSPVKIGPDGKPIKKMVGDYSPESRRARIARWVVLLLLWCWFCFVALRVEHPCLTPHSFLLPSSFPLIRPPTPRTQVYGQTA